MSVDHPTDLAWAPRRQFLLRPAHPRGGGDDPGREPAHKIGGAVWGYAKEVRHAPEYAYDDRKHGELRAEITAQLERLMREAYAELEP
jgi:hypothetical protein